MTFTEPTPTVPAKRGGCLSAFLVLMLIVNPLTAIYYFIAGATIQQNLPNMPGWIIPLLVSYDLDPCTNSKELGLQSGALRKGRNNNYLT